uniref:Uncharacterized protein n=1 Tax=Caloglossa intermedia TaxID=100879 RepID=A0A1Z1M6M4_9FLOR|nr:hypothetical protein [Caloglossa intermedia]ARW61491.1 hypothetical protein [Caloglossa intermedia]
MFFDVFIIQHLYYLVILDNFQVLQDHFSDFFIR